MSELQTELYPFRFKPVIKGYPWGGRRIANLLGRAVPPGPAAESWEISDHPDGQTAIVNGPLAGRPIEWLLRRYGELLVGDRNRPAVERGLFPLLVKILDAREWLSVQVHPDDGYAVAHEGDLGKTEMWIVLAAEPESEILLGFRRNVDEDTFRRAIRNGTAADCLHRVGASAGDVFFVPPGTVHAIGPGLLIAEVQQSSNVTYRVFDWNRRPARTLHIDRSLAVLDFDMVEPGPVEPRPLSTPNHELLAHCQHFRTERLRLGAGEEFDGDLQGDSFEIWGTLDGAATVTGNGESISLTGVSWALLPAALGTFRVTANEPTTLLRILTLATG